MNYDEICPPGFKNVQEWLGFRYVVECAVKSGFTPIKDTAQGMVIALRGRELDIPPIEALNSFQVIQGKLTLSAEGMLAQVHKKVPGVQCRYITEHENSHVEAEYEVVKPGGQPQTFKFTKKDAERAGIWGRGGWNKYPAAMLRSRCVSAMVRAAFPEALAGQIYTPEEVENFDTGTAPPTGQLGAGLAKDVKAVNKTHQPSRPKRELAPIKTLTDPRVIAKMKAGETVSSQLDAYVVPEGKHKGKMLRDLSRLELATLLGMVRKAKTDHSKEIEKNVEEFLKSGGGTGVKAIEKQEEVGGALPIGQIPGMKTTK